MRSTAADYSFQMGLLSILRKQREREREIRVLILGLDNAGKTTITKKFLGEDLSLVEPTLGVLSFLIYLDSSWKCRGFIEIAC